MSILHCQNISYSYGNTAVLRDLSFSIEKPGVYGFLGVNGAGKSTTLRIINGFLRPQAGEINIFGLSPSKQTRAMVGYMPQNPPAYHWMTGMEMLQFCAKLRGVRPEEEQRWLSLVDSLQLTPIIHQRIKGYSGGEKQKLSFIAAVLGNTKLLLLDEPVAAMDPIGRAQVLNIIQELGQEKAIFFSTHILADVERICDGVTVLHNGTVLRSQPVSAMMFQNLSQIGLLRCHPIPPAFLQTLQETLHVKLERDEQEEDSIRILCEDRSAVEEALPGLMVRHNVSLRHFEWKEYSMEEIFIRLVEKQ
ncbi:MAG: ABC transporter ATP-binding protein [Myxococcota bacterium]|nr:ABC transporter ATP-binding protein [Myxococcota bacterium]